MFESLLYGAVGIFIILCASILILKSLTESCLGCLGTILWIIFLIWLFRKCTT